MMLEGARIGQERIGVRHQLHQIAWRSCRSWRTACRRCVLMVLLELPIIAATSGTPTDLTMGQNAQFIGVSL